MDQEYTDEYIESLAGKWKDGTLTDAEQEIFDAWYNSHQDQKLVLPHGYASSPSEIRDRMHMGIKAQIRATHLQRRKYFPIPQWQRIIAAACIFMIVGTATYFYLWPDGQHIKNQAIAKDIAPGGNKATLTLANGKVIRLDEQKNGTVLSEAGVIITKTTDGQVVYNISSDNNKGPLGKYNTISTPNGGTYQVNLPDGSKVRLNAASTLTFAASLRERGEKNRRVILSGEAYFEIARDKAHPFVVVTTSKQEIEVLGTHFNVNAYTDEKAIRTTLLEGSVRIHTLSPAARDIILKPGEQSVLTANSISISDADLESVMGWKEGLFVFHDADVPTVMRQLSRWYNIEVEYSGAIPKDLFTGGISRQSNLSTVLKMLELIKIRGRIVQTEHGKKLIITNP
ncbi:FecR domain-containing protein [Pedobacter sp. ISL-68]|uniref:FecR family protein n=1 Tax=unclassified Pedobacter TaxID=2628915 RepID=UPI001BEA70E8|nr:MULTISPECIES: FecR family protein [unclassified Pedobacter]MBT2561318.1 FecR domain-containing protein [Pedobacter sp. ISL-64]MBT2590707.1 FecR domain-containing protein [Pedobacter sp. ISL-68]